MSHQRSRTRLHSTRHNHSGWVSAGYVEEITNPVPGQLVLPGTIDDTIISVPGHAISPGSIDIAKFAAGIIPPRLLAVLPTLPNAAFPQGSMVYLTSDNKLYRTDGATWTAAVAVVDLTGQIPGSQIAADSITAGQIAAGAISASELAAGAVVAGKIAAQTITGSDIAANTITGSNIKSGTVSADRIYGITIDASQITSGSISANKIYGGTITASNISGVSLTGVTITGSNIAAGGGGYDGLTIVNGYGNSIGWWNQANGIGVTYGGIRVGSLDIQGSMQGTAGYGNAGWGSTVPSVGATGYDYGSGTYGRWEVFNGTAWKWIALTAGFVVPVEETICHVCERALRPGEDMIGRGDRYEEDGALHGLWIHFSCAGKKVKGDLADRVFAAQKSGDEVALEAFEQAALAESGVVVHEFFGRHSTGPHVERVLPTVEDMEADRIAKKAAWDAERAGAGEV